MHPIYSGVERLWLIYDKNSIKREMKNMKNKSIAGLIAIVAIIMGAMFAGCVEDMSPEQIAREMQEKQDSIEDITMTMSYSNLYNFGEDTITEIEYIGKKPNMMRMEYILPAEMAGQVMVLDGKTLWMYYPAENQVITVEVPEIDQPFEADPIEFIEEVLNNSETSLLGSKIIAGRSTYVIEMIPKETGEHFLPGKTIFWIDKETWMPLKNEMYDNEGKLVNTMEYKNIEINTGVPDSVFEFKIPEGAEVKTMEESMEEEKMTIEEAQANASFDILEPTYLPSGYEFDNVHMGDPKHNDTMIWLIYTNGEDFLDLDEDIELEVGRNLLKSAENVTINGQEGKLIEEGRALYWTIGDIGLILHSGSLSKDEMIKIAESVG
jgi:outer membrane lipoprotein-sorting protein